MSAALPEAAGAATTTTTLVFGDSLMYESRYAIATEVATHPGWRALSHAFPGSAVCDWIPWVAADLALYHPSVVAIETVGNSTRPCMVDANGVQLVAGSPTFYDKIVGDLATIFQMVTASGARVVFVKGPPMLDAAWNSRVNTISARVTALAKTLHGVSVTGKPRVSVSTNGRYATYKSCLANEVARPDCSNGQIAIRTLTGVQTGIHFCPAGLAAAAPYDCATYSSGEYRFGRAVGRILYAPPRPLNP